MTRIQRSALVQHSAGYMYGLVGDVLSYPDFLPWCTGVSILEQTDRVVQARVQIKRGGVGISFVTCNCMQPEERIEITLKEGPFSALHGLWVFQPLAEDACKVSLDLQVEIKNLLLRSTVGRMFEQVANTMVEAFCGRADELAGGSLSRLADHDANGRV